MLIRSLYFILIIFSAGILSCSRKSDNKKPTQSDNLNFSWKEELKASDIPASIVKGRINGEEVKFQYINFERWHGSNDNVLNFSLAKPEHACGYIENYAGFRLVSKGNPMKQGEFNKPNFSSAVVSYEAAYFYLSSDGQLQASNAQWNCVLSIDNIAEKTVTGKIALCFRDETKSWLAGKFEAQICNN